MKEIRTPADLENSTDYERHHSAYCRGYVSRKTDGYIEPYKGKFGEGYVAYRPLMDKVFKMSYAERIEKFATSEQKKMIADAIAEHPDCKITEYSNA